MAYGPSVKLVDTGRLTYGQATADWQERLNVDRMRQYRESRAREIMRKQGVAVILEGVPQNLRYLTGLIGFPMGLSRYVLFFADSPSIMWEHSGWYAQMPDQAPWIPEFRAAHSWLNFSPGMDATLWEAKQFAEEIAQVLRDKGMLGEKIAVGGVDGYGLAALAEAGVTNIVPSQPLLLEARMIKNEDEINCLKMIAAICDGIWFKVWETARPGMRDTDLGTIVAATGYELGAEFAHPGGWRSGPMTFDRGFSTTGRLLQTGDIMYGSVCGFTYMGYGSCTYRTLTVGAKPSDKQKDWYKQVVDRIDSVISEIKPGASTDAAAKHFPPSTKWGYASEHEILASEIGHGIGLGGMTGYDHPIVNRQWSLQYPQEFQEGMCLAIESREGEVRVGGARLENMVVVTKNGVEIIDTFQRDEVLQAPR